MAKNYIYTEKTIKESKMYGNRTQEATIYRVEKNRPIFVDRVQYNTASTKGATSEVYQKLNEKKLVSDKEYKSNSGYYNDTKSKVTIDEVR
jgi:hypothetical protein